MDNIDNIDNTNANNKDNIEPINEIDYEENFSIETLENITDDVESDKKTVSLKSSDNATQILDYISKGEKVELDVDKQTLISNFNTFMLAEAYGQLPTVIKLHELQTRCLDKYYEQVNEMLDNDDVNVFLLDKIITTINNSIDRCNNIILKLGLNSDITDQLMIKHIDNSQTVNVFQSQISKQKVIDTINTLVATGYISSDENTIEN